MSCVTEVDFFARLLVVCLIPPAILVSQSIMSTRGSIAAVRLPFAHRCVVVPVVSLCQVVSALCLFVFVACKDRSDLSDDMAARARRQTCAPFCSVRFSVRFAVFL